MNKRDHARLVDLVKQCGPEVILRAASLCDGHTIFDPKAFTEAGLPAEVVEHVTTTHKSDGSPKGTIFESGKPLEQLRGVYGLQMLRYLADALCVKYAEAFGRGTEARNIQSALHQHYHAPDIKPLA